MHSRILPVVCSVFLTLVGLVCVYPTTGAAAQAGNLIKNGSFSTPDITTTSFITRTSAPAGFEWDIVLAPGNGFGVDQIASLWVGTGGPVNSAGHDQSVDIDFDNAISQDFATTPGVSYGLSFFYSHNIAGSSASGNVTVTGNSVLVSQSLLHNTPNSAALMEWTQFSATFVADSTTTNLTIAGVGGNLTLGFVVDDVVVARTASSATRNGGNNPASYTADAPILGATWNASVDLTTTGHSLAQVFGFTAPTNVALPGGQTLLATGSRIFKLPLRLGPVANYTQTIPNDLSLAGVELFTQAVHVFGLTPFALSNAVDFVVGL